MRIFLYKSFTNNPKEGNPAGVIENAESLSDKKMIRIAAELGFSESAFLNHSKTATPHVRFFSPQQEVDFCGHAALAAAFHVMQQKKSSQITLHSKKTVTTFTKQGKFILFPLQKSQFLESYKPEIAAPLLGINTTQIEEKMPIELLSVGVAKLIIPIKTLKDLQNIKPNLAEMKKLCKATNIAGFYAVTQETMQPENDFHARQFNPAAGINEDPLTGVAAGALGAYVQKNKILDKSFVIIEQGHILAQPGSIKVQLNDPVSIGGTCVKFGEKILDSV